MRLRRFCSVRCGIRALVVLLLVSAPAPVFAASARLASEATESSAGAATINVSPTKLVLTRQAASTSLVLRNESDEAVRFQVTAVRWANKPSGEMELVPTDDLVFFPTLFVLEPKQSRRLRVAASQRADDRELAYRLMIEQLPDGSRAPGQGVQMLVRASVPVFVQPKSLVARVSLDDLSAAGGKARFTVRNIGTVHIVLRDVAVSGRLRSGAPAPEQRAPGWYLLPGESREFELPVPADSCADWTAMRVAVRFADTTPGGPLVDTLDLPAGACARQE